MYPSTRTLTRMALVALLMMWLATLARTPGGLSEVAAEIEAVEHRIGKRLVDLERPIVVEEHGSSIVEYTNGFVCERDRMTEEVIHCDSLLRPGMAGY